MKHKTEYYAQALGEALAEAKQPNKVIAVNLRRLLDQNGDRQKLSAIVKQAERFYLKKKGLHKVVVESADPLPSGVIESIRQTIGRPVEIVERVKPVLLAGLTLLIDQSTFIDGSARGQLQTIVKTRQ